MCEVWVCGMYVRYGYVMRYGCMYVNNVMRCVCVRCGYVMR